MYVPVLSPHGLRCGSSSRCPGHGRPESPPFSVSPCLGLHRISWNGGIVTFENCPHGLRNWKREGLGACARLGCAPTQRQLHRPAQMRCAGGSDLRKWPNDECLPNLQGEFQCANIRWNPQSAVNDAETTPASSPPNRDGAAALPADGGSEPCSFESTTPRTCRSAGRVEGEQLSTWKILVPMRLPQ